MTVAAAPTLPPHAAYTPRQRAWTTFFLMLGAIMNMIDTTIANVALPQMQGTTSTSREEITWVLTSYVIATAIATPLVGWLTTRWSRKTVLLASIAGFTFFSVMCGLSTTIGELVLFRICQGASGAALVPLNQSTLLDIYPREDHGKAMAVFQISGVTGPLIGPVLGGFLTSNFSWGWVFLVNFPVGALAFFGLAANLRPVPTRPNARFDGVSFALLALAIGSLQLMLDRGSILDWFDSDEIIAEAFAAAAALAGFLWVSAHRTTPYIPLRLLHDRNFTAGTALAFIGSAVTMSVMAIIPEMMSQLYGYPAEKIGALMAPRGAGTILMTPIITPLMRRCGLRPLMAAGIVITSLSVWMLGDMTLDADGTLVVVSGLLQGIASSLLWTPMTLLTYSTIPPDLRDQAAGFHILVRFLGTAIGISVLQTFTLHDAAETHAALAATAQLQNLPQALRDLAAGGGAAQMLSAVNAEVTRQAAMIAHVDSFRAVCLAQLATLPLLPLLRTPRPEPATRSKPA